MADPNAIKSPSLFPSPIVERMAIEKMRWRSDVHFSHGFFLRCRFKPPLLNHPEHITHILHHNPGDVGHGVDVMLGMVGEADAGHEVEVFEDGVEAFGGAGVEVA